MKGLWHGKMKFLKKLFALFSMFWVISSMGYSVMAMNTGFNTEPFPENDVKALIKNIELSFLTEEPTKASIVCFDVSDNGNVAIGNQISEQKTVCIYDADGNFKHGYTFTDSGSFSIELDNELLMIYFVRGGIAVSVDFNGDILEVAKIRNTVENNSYWNNVVDARTKKAGEVEYSVKNNMGILNIFATSYSQLVAKGADGQKHIVYDVSSIHLIETLFIVVGVILFVGIVTIFMVSGIRKNKCSRCQN